MNSECVRAPLIYGLISDVGYLGAGKTTLVNYILREQHGKKIAVILNGVYTLSMMFLRTCPLIPFAEFGDCELAQYTSIPCS